MSLALMLRFLVQRSRNVISEIVAPDRCRELSRKILVGPVGAKGCNQCPGRKKSEKGRMLRCDLEVKSKRAADEEKCNQQHRRISKFNATPGYCGGVSPEQNQR